MAPTPLSTSGFLKGGADGATPLSASSANRSGAGKKNKKSVGSGVGAEESDNDVGKDVKKARTGSVAARR